MSELGFAIVLILIAYWAGSALRRVVDRAKERPKEPKPNKKTVDLSRFGADYTGKAGILVVQSLFKTDEDKGKKRV